MNVERRAIEPCGRPFSVYDDLVGIFLAAHGQDDAERDPLVAHILGTCAGYAYADVETVAMILARLGLEGGACVRIAQTVDAMYIFSTAYLVQSRCGRVAILCYRGTEPSNLGNWLADADVGAEAMTLGGESLAVHSGFLRNVRSTRWTVLSELSLALQGHSLLDPRASVENPLEALYVTGHSLGGAMAVIFALSLAGGAEGREIGDRLRAVYTFGQPLATGAPLPEGARAVARKLYRHINARDIIPSLPPAVWGRFTHFGREYRYADGAWRRAETPVTQLANLREVPRALLAFFANARRRDSSRYTMTDHAPHLYVAALRPAGRVNELGDPG